MKRALFACLKVLALALVFVAGAVAALLLHVDFAAPRAFAVARVNQMLSTSFKGKLVITKLDGLRLTGLDGGDAELYDPEGELVGTVEGVSARLSPWGVLRSLFSGKQMVIRIDKVTIRKADVRFIEDENGEFGFVRAFDPAEPEPETEEPSAPTPDIRIDDIVIDQGHFHMAMAAIPRLDADLTGLTGAFGLTATSTAVDVAGVDIRSEGIQGLSPQGHLAGTLVIPNEEGGEQAIDAVYRGLLGEIPVVATARMEGDEILGVADVGETKAAAVRAILPGTINLQADVRAHAEVRGTLPNLHAFLEADIGEGGLELTADARVPQGDSRAFAVSAEVRANNIDLGVIEPSAPRSRLGATLFASVESDEAGKLLGWAQLRSEKGVLAEQVVPELEAWAEIRDRSVFGSAHVGEEGAPIALVFALEPRGREATPSIARFQMDALVPALDRVPRIGKVGRGSGHLWAGGSFDLETNHIHARTQVEANRLDLSGIALGYAFAEGRADGLVSSPDITASARTVGMRAAGFGFPSANVTARGSLRDIAVNAHLAGDEKTPSIHANARVGIGDSITVRGLDASASNQGVSAEVTATSIEIAGGSVRVHGARVVGLGAPITADATISGASVTLRAKTDDLDFERVTKLLAREEDIRGHLAFDVDATLSGRTANGKVEAHGWGVSSQGIEDARIDASLAFVKGTLDGRATVALQKVGFVELSASGVKPGRGSSLAQSWAAATGSLGLRGDLDLAGVLKHLPREVDQVAAARGRLTIEGEASRPRAGMKPVLELVANTEGLMLVGSQGVVALPGGALVAEPPPWRVLGYDGDVRVSLDESGKTTVTTHVRDAAGTLVSADAAAKLPFERLGVDVARWKAELPKLALEAHVAVPRRPLERLPPEIGALPLAGEVELAAAFEGTLQKPKLELKASVGGVRPLDASNCARTFDLDVALAYENDKADLRVAAVSDGKKVLTGKAEANLPLPALLIARDGKLPEDWTADADLTLDGFPLDAAEALVAEPVTGTASGKLELRNLHRDAQLKGDFTLDSVTLADAKFPKAKGEVSIRGGELHAMVRLDQTDGYAQAKADGKLAWGADITPRFDVNAPVEIALQAKNFRALVARPFLKETLTDLDGRIDANTKIKIEKAGTDGSMEGAIALREGVFGVPQLGETFKNMKGQIIIKPWGTVRFDDFSAEGPTGKLTASAQAELDGIAFRKANAKIHIERDEALPIAIDGVPMGRAYGDVKADATLSPNTKKLTINVDVPMLHVELPQSTGNSPQSLAADDTVKVGYRERGLFSEVLLEEEKEPNAPSDMEVLAAITLGKDVEVRRDTTLRVKARGKINVAVKETTKVSGQIRLSGGKIELQGKVFTIDRGNINFVGDDAGDPLIVATAHWDAPDKTRVVAEFTGKVSQGRLSLRSDPPMSEDEILALVMFGSPNGSLGASAPPGQEQSTGVQGAGIAGGVVTQGVNKIISGVTSADIYTRIDSSDASGPKPELAVQITKSISASLGYKLGNPSPGDNPDRAELTLDWRFVKNWSLATVVGDQGSTAVDVVWRLRY